MFKIKAFYGHDPESDGKEAFYWPTSEAKRMEVTSVRRGSPASFESVYQGRPGSRSGSIFLEKDFAYYIPPEGLSDGIANPKVLEFCSKGHGVFQAWDTAFEDTNDSAYTVCVTGLFVPCTKYHRDEDVKIYGPCDSHFDIMVLDVYREKIAWGDLVKAFRTQRTKWQPHLSIVEKRMSGISLYQSMISGGVPIHGAPAVEGKRARAVNGVGAGSAQGWFRLHRVLFPGSFADGTVASWLEDYKTELKDFTGDGSGLSDQADATVHLIRYAIVEGATTALLPSEWSPERGSEADIEAAIKAMGANTDPRAAFLTMLGDLPTMSQDPFAETCGRCSSWQQGHCKLRNTKTVALDTCPWFSVAGVGNG